MAVSFLPVFAGILSIPLWTYLFLKRKKNFVVYFVWLFVIALNCFIHFFVNANPLLLMLLYISGTFLSFKLLVTRNYFGEQKETLNFRQWLLFCYGWFGMNPGPFRNFPSRAQPDWFRYIIKGFSRIIIGLAILHLAGLVAFFVASINALFLIYLVCLSLILHFGILNISTGVMRAFGVNVTSLFRDPILSKSLQEFWSKRWNLAFVELTTLAVMRPVKKRFGERTGTICAYIFSGLLHEMAISLPVNAGYGKPFLYFIIQAACILVVEKYVPISRMPLFLRLAWLLLCLFVPVFLLFHEQFLLHSVIPLVHYLIVTSPTLPA